MKPVRRIGRIIFSLLAFTVATSSLVLADTVPDLTGRHLSEIEIMPEIKDISLEIQKVDSTIRQSEVLLQIPGAGSKIGTGRRIYLKVSNGVLAPNLLGRTKSEAEATLKNSGIRFAITHRPDNGVRNNRIAAQIPEAGTRFDASQRIIFLIVSDGKIVVPNLIGETYTEAINHLKRLGLKGRIEPPEPLSSIKVDICTWRDYDNHVNESDPSAGAMVEPGEQVIVYYTQVIRYRNYCPKRINPGWGVPYGPVRNKWGAWEVVP